MADWNGAALRRVLNSAERLRERAMEAGLLLAKTLGSKSSALLPRVTSADHRAGARLTLAGRRRCEELLALGLGMGTSSEALAYDLRQSSGADLGSHAPELSLLPLTAWVCGLRQAQAQRQLLDRGLTPC